MQTQHKHLRGGFTIVELLIVIVVIGILATISIVAYSGIQQRARDASATSAAVQAFKKLESFRVLNGAFASSLAAAGIADSPTTTYAYRTAQSGASYCVSAQTGSAIYSVQNSSAPVRGDCGQVVASYYSNIALSGSPVLVQSENAMNGTWGAGSPDPKVPSDNFSARFVSNITAPVSGTYVFSTNTDDSAELIVNGVTLTEWTVSGTRIATSSPITLAAGQTVPIEYSMKEYGGSAYATLSWSYPGQSNVVVPATVFSRQ